MSSKVQRGKIGTLKITFITDYLKKIIIIIIPGEKLYLSEGKSISGQISQNKKKNIVHSTLKIFFQYKNNNNNNKMPLSDENMYFYCRFREIL